VDTGNGDLSERRLGLGEQGEEFYQELKQRNVAVRMGMEASGHARWFERLLTELNIELWIGDAAEIRTKRVRQQKTDRQDAQLLLQLMLENRARRRRKSFRRFRDRVRMLTRRSAQRKTAELIHELNPTLRGWAEYYKRAHVRTLFHKLDGWVVRRIWSHRFRRWRTRGWIQLPKAKLYEEFGLVNLISLIPSLGSHSRSRASS